MDSFRPGLEMALGRVLLPLAKRWRAAADVALGSLGLSHASGWVLIHIGRMGDAVPQSELAAEADMQGPSLVPLIDRLESDGLAIRRPDGVDRRVNRICLTDAGRALVSRIEEALRKIRGDMLAEIAVEDLETTVRVLQQVNRAILNGKGPPM